MPGWEGLNGGTGLGRTTQGICSFSDLSQFFLRQTGKVTHLHAQTLVAGKAFAVAVEEVPEWEELDIAIDSGASVTVIGRDMVKAVEAKGARPEIKYEVADGSQI